MASGLSLQHQKQQQQKQKQPQQQQPQQSSSSKQLQSSTSSLEASSSLSIGGIGSNCNQNHQNSRFNESSSKPAQLVATPPGSILIDMPPFEMKPSDELHAFSKTTSEAAMTSAAVALSAPGINPANEATANSSDSSKMQSPIVVSSSLRSQVSSSKPTQTVTNESKSQIYVTSSMTAPYESAASSSGSSQQITPLPPPTSSSFKVMPSTTTYPSCSGASSSNSFIETPSSQVNVLKLPQHQPPTTTASKTGIMKPGTKSSSLDQGAKLPQPTNARPYLPKQDSQQQQQRQQNKQSQSCKKT